MKWLTRRRDVYTPAQQDAGDRIDAEAILAAEREKIVAADQAVAESAKAVQTEAGRLRDSREIAAALREHVRQNGFTERVAASMRLRERGV